jgi:hypothetical protein
MSRRRGEFSFKNCRQMVGGGGGGFWGFVFLKITLSNVGSINSPDGIPQKCQNFLNNSVFIHRNTQPIVFL